MLAKLSRSTSDTTISVVSGGFGSYCFLNGLVLFEGADTKNDARGSEAYDVSDAIEIYACFCTGDEDGLTLECSWRWGGGGENGEIVFNISSEFQASENFSVPSHCCLPIYEITAHGTIHWVLHPYFAGPFGRLHKKAPDQSQSATRLSHLLKSCYVVGSNRKDTFLPQLDEAKFCSNLRILLSEGSDSLLLASTYQPGPQSR
jgi:hypothetical protein